MGAVRNSITLVGSPAVPAQIAQTVVGAVAVVVAHLFAVGRLSHKGNHYQPVHKARGANSVLAENHRFVWLRWRANESLPEDTPSDTSRENATAAARRDRPVDAAYSAQVRRLVKTLVSDDGKPAFGRDCATL